jgi:hypothetical protein
LQGEDGQKKDKQKKVRDVVAEWVWTQTILEQRQKESPRWVPAGKRSSPQIQLQMLHHLRQGKSVVASFLEIFNIRDGWAPYIFVRLPTHVD